MCLPNINLTHSRKNRRDGATVSSRVLAMSDNAGRTLFAAAEGPASDVDVSTKAPRRRAITPTAKL